MADRLPTPAEVHAYLLATGWSERDVGASTVRSYDRGAQWLTVPRGGDPLRLRSALQALGYIESRPSPEEQVRRAIVEHARREEHDDG